MTARSLVYRCGSTSVRSRCSRRLGSAR